jgi:hypothetical protein
MNIRPYLLLLILFVLVTGCATKPGTGPAGSSQIRTVDALPAEVAADTITVAQFRYVCDMMARDLVRQPFVVRFGRPPVVTIRKLQNKTAQYIDEHIFQETIRAKLMENAGGIMLFRDDASYNDIIEERVRQSNEEMTVTLTDTVIEEKTYDRVREKTYESGSLSGAGGSMEAAGNVETEHAMDMSQTATVKSALAAADFFLRGIIYQVNERDMTAKNEGMAYFQYQFRVVDARNGLIVWEKMLSSKMVGQYMLDAGNTGGDPNDPNAAGGQLPAGWPTGQINVNQPGAAVPPAQTGGIPTQTQPQPDPVQQMQQMQQILAPILKEVKK